MSAPIEDYALIGDTQSAALVARNGSIDWLCLPRFDSSASFASLLGGVENGRWSLRSKMEPRRVERSYRGDTLVLETSFETGAGLVRVVDFMPHRTRRPDLFRIVEGIRGCVEMEMDFRPRFDYGSIRPWFELGDGTAVAIGGPQALALRAPIDVIVEDAAAVASFHVNGGERLAFELAWFPSHESVPPPSDPDRALAETLSWWEEWSSRCRYDGRWRDPVLRSLITVKALTYAPTGGIVAAATTSLPERIGGVRNWDYRYCWIRDATFALMALVRSGYLEEARAWRDWLLRAVAGEPADLQIMYGPAGERRLTELELPWLDGYKKSRPVRIGNAAWTQIQLDVYGELTDAMHQARRAGLDPDPRAWKLQVRILEHLEMAWREPDHSIWEMRGPPRHFTHSKAMAWVAFDRAVKDVEECGLDGPASRWRAIADEIHAEVCERGYDSDVGSFVQFYGSRLLDASLLMLPLVGFLPATDARVVGTIDAIQRELCVGGLVHRYPANEQEARVDALPPGEGAFLPCTFWLVDNLVLAGRSDEATRLFQRLVELTNDVGLLAEEGDPETGCFLGNYPQAFTHVSLIDSAFNLLELGPAHERGPREQPGAAPRR